MQENQTYILAWLIYSAGALGLGLWAAYWVRRWGGSWAAWSAALLFSLVFLLTPARATVETERLAPAFVVAVFDALAIDLGAYDRAGIPLLWMCGAALIAGLGLIAARRLLARGSLQEPAGES